MEQKTFNVSLKLLENYLFQIDFGDAGTFMTDEPEPLGGGEGPAPSSLLGAAVANCLAASLLFAIRKHKEDPGEVSARCEGVIERDAGHWRITRMNVNIRLGKSAANLASLGKALARFEDFCVVTQSVRKGIPVDITVTDADGQAVTVPEQAA